MTRYRIREAFFVTQRGRRLRAFVAERRVRFLGIIPTWVAVDNSEPRANRVEAERDLQRHVELNRPLSEPRVIDY